MIDVWRRPATGPWARNSSLRICVLISALRHDAGGPSRGLGKISGQMASGLFVIRCAELPILAFLCLYGTLFMLDLV